MGKIHLGGNLLSRGNSIIVADLAYLELSFFMAQCEYDN
jgi:hypothetical protein